MKPMKKTTASQSAPARRSLGEGGFFNLRLLIGLFIVLAGVFLALAGLGTFSAVTANSAQAQQKPRIITNSTDPLVPNGFDCSKIYELGIDKQENLRAGLIMIACGETQGGSASPSGTFSQFIQKLLPPPLTFGTTDVDLISPQTDSGTNITQSETYATTNPDDPNQIVVAYNDSRGRLANPINISGASVSTDGGTTFTRLTKGNGQSPFDGTEGDPVVLYNRPTGTWFTVWLDTGCSAAGLGGYKSTNPSDPNSWTHFCVHNNNNIFAPDDRESGWADNNPSSLFFGRMYVSWNNFNVGGGALFVRYSTDNGLTWTNERQLSTTFFRDVQITGDLATGDVYVAAMNEGPNGGLAGPRSNKIYRSTDGGNTWTNTYTGPNFAPPGRVNCGANTYFVCMYPDSNLGFTGYWRHMGWGEPAALNGVVSLVYAQHGAGADPGDVFYIRSTDKGQTFGAPVKLNTDTTTRLQWQPNLSVSSAGTLLSVWYDERETTGCTIGNPAVPCYRMWARKSTDNGVTWLADMQFSDVVTPLPDQPDSGIQPNYAGDYDYGSALGTDHVSSWTDGRVTISSQSQQDAFFDKEPTGAGGIPCGDLVSFQVRCKHTVSGDRLQAKLTLTNTSHSGEQVTITVDGNPNSVTINGSKATLQINNEPLGQHTVELTDPAGCFAPVITNCQ